MYDVDSRDRVVELTDVPACEPGAPLPIVVADEYKLQLAYLARIPNPGWDGTSVRIVDLHTNQPVALLTFERAWAWSHGPPNDEAFQGHPLAARGLHPYGAFRIEDSSWVRRLERMNSVHRHHRPEVFNDLHHYVFAFHDSTFECVARGFRATLVEGPLADVASQMAQALSQR